MTEEHYRPHDLKWIFHQIDERNISIFVRFYDENEPLAFNITHMLIPKGAESRSTLIQTFHDLWKSPPNMSDVFASDPETWLIFEIRNRASKYLQMNPSNPADLVSVPTVKWELDIQENPTVFKALKASWNRFDKEAKRCMELVCFYAVPLYEITDILKIKQEATKKLIHSSLKLLRASLGFNVREESEDSEDMIRAELYGLGSLSGRDARVFDKELRVSPELYIDRIQETLEVLRHVYKYQPQISVPGNLRETLLDELGPEMVTVPPPATVERPKKVRIKLEPKKIERPKEEKIPSQKPKLKIKKEPAPTLQVQESSSSTKRLITFVLFFMIAWVGYQYVKPMFEDLKINYKISQLLSFEEKNDRFISLLGDRESSHTTVYGLDVSPDAKGVIAWNPLKGKGYLFTSGLPETDPSSYYKLWAFDESGATFVDFVRLNEKGESLTKIDTLPPNFQFQKFGVSLEYHRNSFEKPNGNFYLIGDLE